MGRLFQRCVGGEVRFYSRHGPMDFGNIGELYAWADVVILASSMDATRSQLKELLEVSMENPRRVMIFDIASFKGGIVELYSRFPPEVIVASVHPMFGPGVNCFEDQLFLVVPVGDRENDAMEVAAFLESLGARVEFVSSEEHDRLMGFAIGVPYFLGLKYLELAVEKELERFGGTSSRFLTIYGKAVLNDSQEFIEEVIERSMPQIREFIEGLRNVPDVGFLARELDENEIKDAYRRFYRALEP